MARQASFLKMKGTLGGLTFYKSRDGHLIREKGGIERQRILNDPQFIRTRENMAEFGRAAQASKAFRTVFRKVLNQNPERRLASLLTKNFLKLLQQDTLSTRGERNLYGVSPIVMQQLDLNPRSKFRDNVFIGYSHDFQDEDGVAVLSIPAHNPQDSIMSYKDATHYRFFSAFGYFDLTTMLGEAAYGYSPNLPLNAQSNAAQQVTATLDVSEVDLTNSIRFMLIGIEFYKQESTGFYILRNGMYNALQVLDVKTPDVPVTTP
jgi:hypothetical protein